MTFEIRRPGRVTLTVHDISGRLVCSLDLGALPAGHHQIRWDGRNSAGQNVASGMYLLRLEGADGASATAKALLVR